MKKLGVSVLLPLLLTAIAVAFTTNAAPLSGQWQVHNSIAGNESDQGCSFTQSGHDLTGSCSTDHGAVDITGTVDGKKVTWTYKTDYQGSPLTVNYQGVVNGDKITGDVSVPEYSVDGDFTATRSK